MKAVRFSSRALVRLKEIAAFYSSIEEGLGERAVARIATILNELPRSPRLGRPFKEDIRYRERLISFGSGHFLALYSIEDDGSIVVASIKHEKQRSYGKESGDAT